MPETLYLTVNLIDRFLEAKQVTRKHLQLVSIWLHWVGAGVRVRTPSSQPAWPGCAWVGTTPDRAGV